MTNKQKNVTSIVIVIWAFTMIILAILQNACTTTEPMPDAYQCDPGSMCGTCDCDESTALQRCGLCPIGKTDGGINED